MNKDEIIHELNSCLLNDEEFSLKPEDWEDYEDLFQEWENQFESDEEDGEEDGEEKVEKKSKKHVHDHEGHDHHH